jgi:NAD dependent epimerase/dehydratase family enzyme
MKIVIPGGTGQVGSILDRAFTAAGHEVVLLTRRPTNAREVRWDGVAPGPWCAEVGAFALRSDTELLLKSRRVVPGRLADAGFNFDFGQWPAACDDLVRRVRAERDR